MSGADGWNHNTHYHARLLRAVPPGCRRALDVGCGLGDFARCLAGVAEEVDAIDREPAVVRRARERLSTLRNVQVTEADFVTWESAGEYDVVSMIAVLHHLPFADALRKAARLLRPGGVLLVLGLDSPRSFVHAARRSSLAFPVSWYYRFTRGTAKVGAPIMEPTMTLEEIRDQAAALLPGATVQRHVLWRYSLIWVKPVLT